MQYIFLISFCRKQKKMILTHTIKFNGVQKNSGPNFFFFPVMKIFLLKQEVRIYSTVQKFGTSKIIFILIFNVFLRVFYAHQFYLIKLLTFT